MRVHRHYGTVPSIQKRESLHSHLRGLLYQVGGSICDAGSGKENHCRSVCTAVPYKVFGAAFDTHGSRKKPAFIDLINFGSHLFAGMCKLLGIKTMRTTVYHSQLDSMVERFDRTIGTMKVAYNVGHPQSWDDQLPLLMMAYRVTPHKSTSSSPDRVMLGREIAQLVDFIMKSPSGREWN